MAINLDKLKFSLEGLDIELDCKMEMLHAVDGIQKEIRDLEFKYERISRDKSTLYTLLNRTTEDLEEAMRQLEIEKGKSERLLLNILPSAIADQLKLKEDIIADIFPEVSLLFADIVNFTPMSSQLSPGDLIIMLNEVFSAIDELAEKHKLEKIKTIGDAYMVVGGLPTPRPDHAEAIADMALDIQNIISNFKRVNGDPLSMRIGIHTGPVVAGIIGKKKFSYDLWGDTVNTASRMESHSLSGEIQATAETYEKLKGKYTFEKRGMIDVKGKGEMMTYFLKSRKNLN
jgi:adenylate cyclase